MSVPAGVVGFHFTEVGVIADVVADAVFIDIGVDLRFTSKSFGNFEGFEDRAGIRLAATEVINLADAWRCHEGRHEAGHIERVDVVAHLLALVAEEAVFPAFQVAFHQIAEEAMQFHTGVVRAREASATQAAGGHDEVAPLFLHDHIRRHFRGTEERVLALSDREGFGNSVLVGGVRIIPAGFEFAQGNEATAWR